MLVADSGFWGTFFVRTVINRRCRHHRRAAADLPALERELAELLVKALSLELSAADIEPTASLFGEGLGLDSIDILEVALEISHRYGFQLRSDDADNQTIFLNLRSLAAHVAQHRNK